MGVGMEQGTTFERDLCLLLHGKSAAFVNPALFHIFPGFGQEWSNPGDDFFDNYEIEMVQKKKLNIETKGILLSISLWSKAGLAKLS